MYIDIYFVLYIICNIYYTLYEIYNIILLYILLLYGYIEICCFLKATV